MQIDWANWIGRAVSFTAVTTAFALFRKLAPPRNRLANWRFDEQQKPEPLPPGMIGGAMWAVGIALSLTFFALRQANHLWAKLDGPVELTVYATPWIWCFFPGFAALSVPWPLTVWYLRKVGRRDEADGICDEADSKSRMETFRVMKWLSFGLVAPIGLLTLLAIPIHLSIGSSEARLGHYRALRSEVFPFSQAIRATFIDGSRLRDGTLHPARDLVIDFSDGRRLRGNTAGDGGTNIPDEVVRLLLTRTGLRPGHAVTEKEIIAR